MYIPSLLIVPLMAFTPIGVLALSAKTVVYYLFQRSLRARKVLLVALGVHFLSLLAALVGAQLLSHNHPAVRDAHQSQPDRRLATMPRDGRMATPGRELSLAWCVAYATTVGVVVEFAVLFSLRMKLAWKRIGTSVLAANAAYYSALGIGYALTELLFRLDIL
jgi:hypothetical protein